MKPESARAQELRYLLVGDTAHVRHARQLTERPCLCGRRAARDTNAEPERTQPADGIDETRSTLDRPAVDHVVLALVRVAHREQVRRSSLISNDGFDPTREPEFIPNPLGDEDATVGSARGRSLDEIPGPRKRPTGHVVVLVDFRVLPGAVGSNHSPEPDHHVTGRRLKSLARIHDDDVMGILLERLDIRGNLRQVGPTRQRKDDPHFGTGSVANSVDSSTWRRATTWRSELPIERRRDATIQESFSYQVALIIREDIETLPDPARADEVWSCVVRTCDQEHGRVRLRSRPDVRERSTAPLPSRAPNRFRRPSQ